jgi:hypothetical protein
LKRIPLPANFDGEKFVARYGISSKDIIARQNDKGQWELHCPDSVPDVPVFDTPDAAPAKPAAEIAKILADTASGADIAAYLKWLLRTGALPR